MGKDTDLMETYSFSLSIATSNIFTKNKNKNSSLWVKKFNTLNPAKVGG